MPHESFVSLAGVARGSRRSHARVAAQSRGMARDTRDSCGTFGYIFRPNGSGGIVSTRSFRGARIIRFGDFELDVRAAELRRNGVRVRLQEQPYRILVMLLEHPGEVVLREDIRRKLWPNGTIVEVGHGINAAVLRLREALGESAENPRYVETLARRGYRFAGQPDVVYKERVEGSQATLPRKAISTPGGSPWPEPAPP